jgi:hypothetical protein
MGDLLCAALMAITICVGFHENGLAAEGRVFFGDANKVVKQPLPMLEEYNMWRGGDIGTEQKVSCLTCPGRYGNSTKGLELRDTGFQPS